ncbi:MULTISPECIES: glycosyltransferase family 4 protein [Pseudomonas]|jgi:glycosyltransferase involved in cell wall biosynthesis|uniref:glycosyltransferase family 4 protein n=1 Tax=Pseudomonas TaxID=286 RepID=UPI002D1E349B|nr:MULTISPECIES: glycosyltransferase family 4 protein [Pseudomonas]
MMLSGRPGACNLGFRRLALVSNQAFSIVNFRGELIRDMVARGVEVYAFAPDHDEHSRKQIRQLGATPVEGYIGRSGMNPFVALWAIVKTAWRLRSFRVDAVFSYFPMPVILGGLAARLAGVRIIYSMIEGAGYVFSEVDASSPARGLLRGLVRGLYRITLKSSRRVFLLNGDDYALFVHGGLVAAEKVVLLPGIGLDLTHFLPSRPPVSPVVFIFVGRLLQQKGIQDFVEAARSLKAEHPEIECIVLGDTDVNPDSIRREEILGWSEEGSVRWVGWVRDVRGWLNESSVLVLPSYYREGIPRCIQEAMALGRPVITTDWVGCRESIVDGVNGFLVPIRSPTALTQAMARFIHDPQLILRMGRESRRIAEARYDVREINRKVLASM